MRQIEGNDDSGKDDEVQGLLAKPADVIGVQTICTPGVAQIWLKESKGPENLFESAGLSHPRCPLIESGGENRVDYLALSRCCCEGLESCRIVG